MVEQSSSQRERLRGRVEAIAVRFSEENTPNGWGTIDNLGISLYVTVIDERLVYILSSTRWSEVESGLKDQNIPYEYKRAPSFSKKILSQPETWNKIEHNPTLEGVNENG